MEDLRESVAEMDEMEALRLESELEKQARASITSVPTSPAALNSADTNDGAAAVVVVANGDAKKKSNAAAAARGQIAAKQSTANGGPSRRSQVINF